jgi:hypothetical protein
MRHLSTAAMKADTWINSAAEVLDNVYMLEVMQGVGGDASSFDYEDLVLTS